MLMPTQPPSTSSSEMMMEMVRPRRRPSHMLLSVAKAVRAEKAVKAAKAAKAAKVEEAVKAAKAVKAEKGAAVLDVLSPLAPSLLSVEANQLLLRPSLETRCL